MTQKDKAAVQVGIVNQSLLAVVQGLEEVEQSALESTTTTEEKLGIKTQLYARVDFHLETARRALDVLEDIIAKKQ